LQSKEETMRAPIAAITVISIFASGASLAAPVTYDIDPKHAHVNFEADHFGGLSVWRGIISGTNGKIVLDQAAKTGTVDLTIDPNTVLTGRSDLDDHLKTPDFFDVAKYPTATYKGTLGNFKDGAPTEVQGNLTLHGVTKPVTLKILSFKCRAHPMMQDKNVCGADANASINREDFGMVWGKNFGFDMKVGLSIQVEALTPKK
jgi:polyisoprenoid-binding protein YceI